MCRLRNKMCRKHSVLHLQGNAKLVGKYFSPRGVFQSYNILPLWIHFSQSSWLTRWEPTTSLDACFIALLEGQLAGPQWNKDSLTLPNPTKPNFLLKQGIYSWTVPLQQGFSFRLEQGSEISPHLIQKVFCCSMTGWLHMTCTAFPGDVVLSCKEQVRKHSVRLHIRLV